jgi:hypothetical protein
MSSSNFHKGIFVTDKTAGPNLYFSAMDVCSWGRPSRLSAGDSASFWYFIDCRVLYTASYRTLDPWGNRDISSNQATRKERMMMILKRHKYFRPCLTSRVPQSTLYKLTSQTYALKNLLALLFKMPKTVRAWPPYYTEEWPQLAQMTFKLYLCRPRRRRGAWV